MSPPHEGNEFKAIQMKYQDHTELLRVMTGVDLKLFFGFITIQLALGAFIMKTPGTVEGVALYLIAIDTVLATVAIVLLRNQFFRRKEVIAILNNINEILGFNTPGVYHKFLSVNVATKQRLWFSVYTCGIAAGLIAFSLLALKVDKVDKEMALSKPLPAPSRIVKVGDQPKLALGESPGSEGQVSRVLLQDRHLMEIAKLVLEYIQALVWPAVTLISLLILRKPLVSILSRIRKAEFPGGVSLDIGEQIVVAQELAEKAQASTQHKHGIPTLPLTEANARMVTLGLQPTPSGLDLSYYHRLASINPNLALAGLRMEIEIIIRNLLKGFKLDGENKEPIRRSLDRLLHAGAITQEQNDFLVKILSICNDAIHMQSVSRDGATSVIDLAGTLLDDYLAWLEWGFSDK